MTALTANECCARGGGETASPRSMPAEPGALREAVRKEYARSALTAEGTESGAARRFYSDEELEALPQTAARASLGCGNPMAVADLREGETVLDLGSGGGIDVLLSARRVGPSGYVYGLDMTEEMLELARTNAAEAGAENVEFLFGYMEDIPLPDQSVDAVISNCVINLSADKQAVLREIARVLRPGGRVGVYDVVAENGMSEAERLEQGSWVGCIAGALTFEEYRRGLEEAGLTGVEITPRHQETDRMHSCTVRARRPSAHPAHGAEPPSTSTAAGISRPNLAPLPRGPGAPEEVGAGYLGSEQCC